MASKTSTSSEVKRRYNNKTYDHMAVYVPKGSKKFLQSYAASHSTTINKIINEYLREMLDISPQNWKNNNPPTADQ